MAFLFPLLPLLAIQPPLDHPLPVVTAAPKAITQQTLSIGSHSSYWLASDDAYWNLPNGSVRFSTPLQLRVGDRGAESVLSLSNPVFLGSGGSGAVFSFDAKQPKQFKHNINKHVAIKVSWKASRSTVRNECNTLQRLETEHVPHVEQCLAQMPYDKDRVMIALQPVVTNRGSSIANLGSSAQENAIKQVVETTLNMLLANVITVDVQPLISDIGEVLFIDFTEAKQLSYPPTASDLTGVIGFCNEMMALIPEDRRDYALECFKLSLKDLERLGTMLQEDVYNVVEGILLED